MTRTVKRVGIAAAVLVGLGTLGLMCERVGERGRYAAAYSSYGAGPEGTRGLFLLSAELGAEPRRWSQDLAGLPDRGVLLALGGCDLFVSRPVSRYEREVLNEWIEAGGVLVVAGAHSYTWDGLGVELERNLDDCIPDTGLLGAIARAEREAEAHGDSEEGDGEGGEKEPLPDEAFADEPVPFEEQFQQDPAGTFEELAEGEELPPARWAYPEPGPLAGLLEVPLRRPARIAVDEESDAEVLLRFEAGLGPVDGAEEGPPAAVAVRRGQGTIVAIASASPFQNRELAEADGGVLFARLLDAYAPAGPVMFDEYHLGVGERRSFTQYLREAGGATVAIQVLILAGFALWRIGARFGSPRGEPPPVPAGTSSYVTAVGTLYRKSKDASSAVALLAKNALQRVAEHHHHRFADAHALARHLDERSLPDHSEAVMRLGALAQTPLTAERDLVARAQEIDHLVARATAQATPRQASPRES